MTEPVRCEPVVGLSPYLKQVWDWPDDVEFPVLLELGKPGVEVMYSAPENRVSLVRGFVVQYEDLDPLVSREPVALLLHGERSLVDWSERTMTGRVKLDKNFVRVRMTRVNLRFLDRETKERVVVPVCAFRMVE